MITLFFMQIYLLLRKTNFIWYLCNMQREFTAKYKKEWPLNVIYQFTNMQLCGIFIGQGTAALINITVIADWYGSYALAFVIFKRICIVSHLK